MTMKHWQANALLLIAGAIWGMGFVAQSTAMENIGPFWFIALRFLVASLVVLPFAVIEAQRVRLVYPQTSSTDQSNDHPTEQLSLKDWGKFSVIGVCLFLGMAAQQVGLLTTSVTNSGFLTGLYVVFTPIIGVLLFLQKPHWIVWISALLAVVGIFSLTGGILSQFTIGDVYTILCAVFFALQVLFIAKFVGDTGRPLALSFTQFLVTAFCATLIALLVETLSWSNVQAALVEILYSGIFASGLAFTLQVIGQRYTSAAQAAIFLSAEAPFAAMFAFIWLGERIAIVGLVGCILILIAMLLVELVPMLGSKPSNPRQ